MPELLLSMWLEMLELAIIKDAKGFKDKQANFSLLYKKVRHDEQGQFHHLLAENHRNALR